MRYRVGVASGRVWIEWVERNRGPEARPVERAETDTGPAAATEIGRNRGTGLANGGLYPPTVQTGAVVLKAVTGWFLGKIAPPVAAGGLLDPPTAGPRGRCGQEYSTRRQAG